DDGELRRQAPHLRRVRGDITRRPEKGRVAEREKAHVADEQIEGAREEREAQGLHEKYRVDEERRGDEQREHDRERRRLVDGHRRRRRRRGRVRRGRRLGGDAHVARPKSPDGRTSSTSAMMTKITVFEASG